MNYEDIKARLAEIEKLDDLEEQGYQAAPIIAAITGAPVSILLDSIKASPFDGMNGQRDRGMARWCREQMGIDQGTLEA